MSAMWKKTLIVAAVLLAFPGSGGISRAEVVTFQNGVAFSAKAPQYAGCKDTWISDENWEKNGDNGGRMTLRCGGKRRILIRFDISAVPKADRVQRAVLRLVDVGYPRPQGGTWAVSMAACRVTRPWNADANWLEHTRTNYKEADEGDWKTPGGDVDQETDFGQGATGVIAADTLAFRPEVGHCHDLDVTAVVRRWHAGELPNEGLAIFAPDKSHGCEVAASEWYVPAARPALIVYHGPEGTAAPQPATAPAAPSPGAPGLAPPAATPDAGEARGEYAPVCVGQNAACAIRGASTDAYVKEAVERFPGEWGWMTMCRVGGSAGDFSRALLYFDLKEIPQTASIQKATLRLTLVPQTSRQVTNYRYGAFVLRLPEAPGWSGEVVTSTQRYVYATATPWPEGGVVAASAGGPVAVGKVVMKEIEDSRGHKQRVPGYLDLDLTGVVRAWVQGGPKTPNCGLVLDNRIEGGAYDFYSSRSFRPQWRPYLEITLSPAIAKKAEPIEIKPASPPGEYWVAPMRAVHSRFKGKPGTLAQYGDSITVTMAYLAGYSWAGKIEPKNCPPEVRKEMDVVAKYSDLKLWRTWKGGEWGNTGMMRSDWLINNIDAWQRKMNPEASVILFGTNDLGGICPPEYTENMAASIRRMLRDGTVPMLTTVPPASGRAIAHEYWLAGLSIARGLKVPLIDYYGEIMRRRPDDWDGRLEKFGKPKDVYQTPTLISGDGTHPSNPKEYVNDFSEKALSSNGYNLRDYMTLRMYYEVIAKVLQPPTGN